MSLALFNLGGDEILLILTLILIMLGARNGHSFGRGLFHGIREFRKATREMLGDFSARSARDHSRRHLGHPFLIALTFFLAIVCLIMALHELSK